MCTVSFVFSNGKGIITHNRDEKTARESAIEPQKYLVNNKYIYFPKDQKAGGTWFAVSENGTTLVLLNGADEKHEVKLKYKKSRGLIVLDLISASSPIDGWNSIDLSDIEPFTIVLFQENKVYQLRWNEIEKSEVELDSTKSHIWSSSTLYPKDIRAQRSQWFYDFLILKSILSPIDLLNFHRNTENSNTENGLIINRNNMLKTLSITQVVIDNKDVTLSYCDLLQEKEFSTIFEISRK